MICFEGMTFCTFWEGCKIGDKCNRALTDNVRSAARAWWGKPNPPICVHFVKPDCFKALQEDLTNVD